MTLKRYDPRPTRCCHDCGRKLPAYLLADLGDGYETCGDCLREVAARWELSQRELREGRR